MQNAIPAGKRKSYDSFDLFKFIASIMIMMVHTSFLGQSRFHLLHPWCRVAIPVFFMISSFLFFSKYDSLPREEQNSYLWKFVKRDLILYLFWFIVYLPFTIIYRDYLHKGIAFFVGSILVGSSFPASWYLIALAIGIIIVAKLNKGIGRWLVPAAAVILYIFCLGQYTYRPLADRIGFLSKIYSATEIRYANSFVVAPIWIWFGRLFVTKKDGLRAVSMKKVLAAFAFSLVLLWIEHHLLYNRGWFTDHNDVYLLCLVSGPLFFWVILKLDIHISCAKFLRCMSTLIYCIHATFIEFLRVYIVMPKLGEYELPWSLLCFFATAAFSLLVGWLILKYSEKIKILKYAY